MAAAHSVTATAAPRRALADAGLPTVLSADLSAEALAEVEALAKTEASAKVGTSISAQRPSAVGGTSRRERKAEVGRRRAARLSSLRTKARNGCSVSLVAAPAHTRSHNPSTVSWGNPCPVP